MIADRIVEIALRAISFTDFQECLELESKLEAERAEAQRKFEAEAWERFFNGN